MRSRARLGAFCLLGLLIGLTSGLGAQEPPKETPPEAPAKAEGETAPQAAPEAPAPTPPPQEAKEKLPFALYIEAATGSVSVHELETSLRTLSTHTTDTTLSWDDHNASRAAVGWKLPRGRGDFRLVFDGYKENGYELHSVGDSARLDPSSTAGAEFQFSGNLLWWTLDVQNGRLTSTRTPPVWEKSFDRNEDGIVDPNDPDEVNNDQNLNGIVDPGEQDYLPADLQVDRPVTDTLDNRAQTWDLLFGNEWGPRRFRGRWWGGFRYFQYEGNVLATAWLSTSQEGEGFTDGSFLRLLNFHQDTAGFGPTGAMEAQFKFFREHLSLFLQGQVAFMVLNIDADTGDFFTLVQTVSQDQVFVFPVPARLSQSQSKSTWHTSAEVGVRWDFGNGLRLEAAYDATGFLDSVLLPTSIRIPETPSQADFGTTAVFNTQDYTVDGWRAGISFQF